MCPVSIGTRVRRNIDSVESPLKRRGHSRARTGLSTRHREPGGRVSCEDRASRSGPGPGIRRFGRTVQARRWRIGGRDSVRRRSKTRIWGIGGQFGVRVGPCAFATRSTRRNRPVPFSSRRLLPTDPTTIQIIDAPRQVHPPLGSGPSIGYSRTGSTLRISPPQRRQVLTSASSAASRKPQRTHSYSRRSASDMCTLMPRHVLTLSVVNS